VSCPHCGVELVLPSAPPPVATCAACGGRATIVVSSSAEDDVVVALVALALRADPDAPVAVAVRRWRRPVVLVVGALAALLALALATAALVHFAPGSGAARAAVYVLGTAVGLSMLLLVESLFAVLVVLALFVRRRRARGVTLRRSVLAVVGGIGMLLLATLLLRLPAVLAAPERWGFADGEWIAWWPMELVIDAVACIAGAWATLRLARAAPYRHVLAVGLVLVLNALVFELPVELANGTWSVGELLVTGQYVPLLFLGAWVLLRFERPAPVRPG
jgi:hypothetical protein